MVSSKGVFPGSVAGINLGHYPAPPLLDIPGSDLSISLRGIAHDLKRKH